VPFVKILRTEIYSHFYNLDKHDKILFTTHHIIYHNHYFQHVIPNWYEFHKVLE